MACVSTLSALDWPTVLPTKTVHCAGLAFIDWEARRQGIKEVSLEDETGEDMNGQNGEESEKKEIINLLKASSRKLEKLTYYDVLGDLPLHATAEEVKKAYHKACLIYHPDKTGRGEEDEVFLKVKAAFDTLSDKTKRKAYDSQMPFDDSVPKGNEIEAEFYDVYGPVFERNLRFDDRLNPDKKQPVGKKNKKKKKGQKGPPSFGNNDTPLDQVHAFYDYWTHFESWRDFSLQAAKLTNNENFDADNVDSRYEKRFIQKEIDRKAKALKREEMARVNLLVEHAMAADPRLRREKIRAQLGKERLEMEKREKQERLERETKEREEREGKEKATRDAEEKVQKSAAKAQREKEKKILRKAKNLMRKLCNAAFETGKTFWTSMDVMYNDLEYLCEQLDAVQLGELSVTLGGADAIENPNLEGMDSVQAKVISLREGKCKEEVMEAIKREKKLQREEELKKRKNGSTNGESKNVWTEEQNKQLQEGLVKFPASLDKNERWTSIAKGVAGKNKKECVLRFKGIREALKQKK